MSPPRLRVSPWKALLGLKQRDRRTPPPGPRRGTYPGDYRRHPRIEYAPHEGDLPDPGEIVWAWVPFEEDYRKGKERPVLIIGRDEPWLLAAPLTSKDHDLDHDQEAREGRFWVDIGSGEWDAQARPSEVRVNRIVRIDPAKVRGRGVRLDERRFHRVASQIRQHY